MILPILIIVPAALIGLGLYALLSRMDVMPTMVDDGARRSIGSGRFGGAGDYDEDALWLVRQVQRIPQGILVGLVAVLALWTLVWLVAFVVGLSMLAV